MNAANHFSMTTFTETTQKVCTYSAISIFLIVAFVISPLSRFFLTSVLMKLVTIALLGYTFYLNAQQTEYLRTASHAALSPEVASQLTINVVCGYVFSLFIGLMIVFVSCRIV